MKKLVNTIKDKRIRLDYKILSKVKCLFNSPMVSFKDMRHKSKGIIIGTYNHPVLRLWLFDYSYVIIGILGCTTVRVLTITNKTKKLTSGLTTDTRLGSMA